LLYCHVVACKDKAQAQAVVDAINAAAVAAAAIEPPVELFGFDGAILTLAASTSYDTDASTKVTLTLTLTLIKAPSSSLLLSLRMSRIHHQRPQLRLHTAPHLDAAIHCHKTLLLLLLLLLTRQSLDAGTHDHRTTPHPLLTR
jgi:hypothetical protein